MIPLTQTLWTQAEHAAEFTDRGIPIVETLPPVDEQGTPIRR